MQENATCLSVEAKAGKQKEIFPLSRIYPVLGSSRLPQGGHQSAERPPWSIGTQGLPKVEGRAGKPRELSLDSGPRAKYEAPLSTSGRGTVLSKPQLHKTCISVKENSEKPFHSLPGFTPSVRKRRSTTGGRAAMLRDPVPLCRAQGLLQSQDRTGDLRDLFWQLST